MHVPSTLSAVSLSLVAQAEVSRRLFFMTCRMSETFVRLKSRSERKTLRAQLEVQGVCVACGGVALGLLEVGRRELAWRPATVEEHL